MGWVIIILSLFSYSFIIWPWTNDLIYSYGIVLCLNEDISPSFAFKSLSSFIIAKYTCRIILSVIIYGDNINHKSRPFYDCWPSSMVEMIKILSKWSVHNDIMKKKQNKQTKLTYYIFLWPICINLFKHRPNHTVEIIALILLLNRVQKMHFIIIQCSLFAVHCLLWALGMNRGNNILQQHQSLYAMHFG